MITFPSCIETVPAPRPILARPPRHLANINRKLLSSLSAVQGKVSILQKVIR